MTGWISDDGEYLGLDGVYGYVPSGDAVFRPQWNTDYRTVTFDYGTAPVWEEDGTWYYIRNGYLYSGESREAAERSARQNAVRYLAGWNTAGKE